MAYKTGIVSTASGLLTEIEDFLVNDCEWTLEATVSGVHKYFSSTGESGNENIHVHLQYNLKDYNQIPGITYWQNQTFPNAPYDHLNATIMQHYNSGTNVATNENTGKIGPWHLFMGGNVGTATAKLVADSTSNFNNRFAVGTHKYTGNIPNNTSYWFTDFNGPYYQGGNPVYIPSLKVPSLVFSPQTTNDKYFYHIDLLHRRWAYKLSGAVLPESTIRAIYAND